MSRLSLAITPPFGPRLRRVKRYLPRVSTTVGMLNQMSYWMRAEFQRLQKRYPEALGGLGVAYVRVDLGDKGIYYRVQAGPVDEARATSICSTLKSQSVGCILVRQ